MDLQNIKRLKGQAYVLGGEGCGEGRVREFRTDRYPLLYLKWNTNRSYCIAHGTLLNVMWQPGWEVSLGKNGHMYMYG